MHILNMLRLKSPWTQPWQSPVGSITREFGVAGAKSHLDIQIEVTVAVNMDRITQRVQDSVGQSPVQGELVSADS